MNIKIDNATKIDKEFILFANKEINVVSGLNDSILDKNIDNDLFGKDKRCKCLIAKVNGNQIGMCMYSSIYWANLGEGIYLSNIYIIPNYRKLGIFKKFIKIIKETEKSASFITCIVGEDNETIANSLEKMKWDLIDLKTYYFDLNK